MPTKSLSSFAKEDAKQTRIRAHGDRARRVREDHTTADGIFFVRLPRDTIRWFKVYAAQQGQSMTAIAQQMFRDFRARAEGTKSSGE
jgi:hypothetical protein